MEALPERVTSDRSLEIGLDLCVMTQAEPDVDERFEHGRALVLQPPGNRRSERRFTDVGKGRPPPEGEARGEQSLSRQEVAQLERGPPSRCQLPETKGVHLRRVNIEQITRPARHDQIWSAVDAQDARRRDT